jgi:hypothetical protein
VCLHPLKSLRAIMEGGLGRLVMAVACGACGQILPKAVLQRVVARKGKRRGPRR